MANRGRAIALGIAAFVTGYVVAALLSIGTTTALHHVWPALGTRAQGPALETLDAGYALLYMVVAGLVGAVISTRGALVLGATFGLLGLLTVFLHWDNQHTVAYQWVLAAGAWPAVWAGTRLARKARP